MTLMVCISLSVILLLDEGKKGKRQSLRKKVTSGTATGSTIILGAGGCFGSNV